MREIDITILTDSRFVNPVDPDWYTGNVLLEDNLVKEALENERLSVARTNWDNLHFDWSSTRYVLFRTTWDYFDRFPEFERWLERIKNHTSFINPLEILYWNLDKHYLKELESGEIRIPPTLFIEAGYAGKLEEVLALSGWREAILKPAVSGAARHTYRINMKTVKNVEHIFAELIREESMMIQEFQENVIREGEVAYMIFEGRFSHAVLKKARPGDFRVQDDFGGTVADYHPDREEIAFAEHVVNSCNFDPVYARVDIIRDNSYALCVSELELIEPELWFRRCPEATGKFARAVAEYMKKQEK